MVKWSDVSLEDIRAINLRIAYAKLHNWNEDVIAWITAQATELGKYTKMLEDIERDWNSYDNVQELYDAVSFCYLLLNGYDATLDTKEKRDARILELAKKYYGAE